MAFKAKASTEGAQVKRYIGAASAFVLAVNPSKDDRNKLLGIESEKDIVYVGTRDIDGNEVTNVNVTVYVKPDVEGVDTIIPVSFFVTKAYRFNNDKTKVQVIDDYGYSAWATQEECKNHSSLLSSKGNPLKISTKYRPAYQGEIELIEFIKSYLNIPEALAYVNNEWSLKSDVDLEECEVTLDMDKLFKGDFSEVKTVATLMPTNKFKGAFGVRTNNDGNQYQMMYTNKVLKLSARDYTAIDADIQNRKNNGGLQNVEIDCQPFREYKVEATDLSNPTESAVPSDPFNSNSPWG